MLMLHSDNYCQNDAMAMTEVLKERLSSSVDGEELTEALVLIRTRAPDLESVRKLNCWACNIGDVNVVRRMPNLEVCSLTINKLTSLRDFAHCHNLQELYVRTNNIQHLSDVHYLKNLQKLRSLWLSENPCASRDNYRLTVLKVLPNLQKLDNVAVTGEEVARAQTEGDDLPVPGDFSFSAVLRESALISEDGTDDRKGENASLSSEKWARPRQKRQQKKREEYWREQRGVGDDSGSVKSGDDGSAQGGKDGGGRSSSDSADGEDGYSSVGSSRNVLVQQEHEVVQQEHEVVQQEHKEEEAVDDYDMVGDVNIDDEAKVDTPGTRAKWALNIQIPDNKTAGKQNNLELEVENLDNVMESGKNDADKNYTGTQVTETNEVEENAYRNSKDEKICQNENDEVGDMFAESSIVGTGSSKVSELLNPDVFPEGNSDVSNSTDSSSSMLVSDKDPAVKLATSVFHIDVAKMAPVDSNTNANTDDDAQVEGAEADRLILEDHLICEITPSFKATEQTDTPLLDNTKLEDTLDLPDSAADQTLTSKHIADLASELKTEQPDLAAQTARHESTSSQTVVPSVSDSREPVNWEEYNRLRVQLGVEPVNRIAITTRSFNSDVMRAKSDDTGREIAEISVTAATSDVLSAVCKIRSAGANNNSCVVANAATGNHITSHDVVTAGVDRSNSSPVNTCHVHGTEWTSHTTTDNKTNSNAGDQIRSSLKDRSDSSEKIRKRIKTPVSFKKGRLSLYDDRLMTQSVDFVSLYDMEGDVSTKGQGDSNNNRNVAQLYSDSAPGCEHTGKQQSRSHAGAAQISRRDYQKMIKSESDLVV